MTHHLRPGSDANLSPGAHFSLVNLNRWRARGNLASQVIDGRSIVPPPSFRLSAPLRRRKPSLCSPFQGV